MQLFASQSQQMVDVSPWAQFGLGGVVIASLFGVLAFFIRQHYAERKEWREDLKVICEKQDQTITSTADKFVVLHEKTLEVIRQK